MIDPVAVAVRKAEEFRDAVEQIPIHLSAPKAGCVLLRNVFAGVNFADVNAGRGKALQSWLSSMQEGGQSTGIPLGFEAIAEVMVVGEGVTGLCLGDIVATGHVGCGYTTH